MRFLSVVAVAATLALGATACGTDTGATPAGGGDPARTLPSGTWVLTAGEDPDGPLALVPTHPVTLEVGPRNGSGPQVGGRVCNSYFAEQRAAADGPLLEGPGSTEMACLEDGVMELESRYLGALARVDTVATSGDDDGLELTGDGVRLVYAVDPPDPEPTLTGQAWSVDSIASGDEPDDTVSSVPGVGAQLRFLDDRRVRVRSGCAVWHGRWNDAGTLHFPPVDLCRAHPGPDIEVAALLVEVKTWQIADGRLTLAARDGRSLGLTPVPPGG